MEARATDDSSIMKEIDPEKTHLRRNCRGEQLEILAWLDALLT